MAMLLTGLVFGTLAPEAIGSIQLPGQMAGLDRVDTGLLLAPGNEQSSGIISRKTYRKSRVGPIANDSIQAPWDPASWRPDQDESISYQLMRHLLMCCTKGDVHSPGNSSSTGLSGPVATAWTANSPAASNAETSGWVFDSWGIKLPSPPGSRLLRPPRAA